MDELQIENVRCFAGEHRAPVRPLTLLVGENSTGKTTFLASLRAAYSLMSRRVPDFNWEPFRLGSFDQIAHDPGNFAESARDFTIGLSTERPFQFPNGTTFESYRVRAKFLSHNGQPSIEEWQISWDGLALWLTGLKSGNPVFKATVDEDTILSEPIPDDYRFAESDVSFLFHVAPQTISRYENLAKEVKDALISMAYAFGFSPLLLSFAPIRTKPQRTYDPTKETYNPEGSHIPLMLARLHSGNGESEYWERLEQFGKSSGLYDSLDIRRFGDEGSDPFQIQLNPFGGPLRNLVDVGYGVSQVIPIIADALPREQPGMNHNQGSMLLIQQPEVHLHPRAQAELGSFFAGLVAQKNQTVVIETHSDPLVSRVRLDVRDGHIDGDDVIILYFERVDGGATIHPIRIDAMGNLLDAPPSYRSFFLQEERRFFDI